MVKPEAREIKTNSIQPSNAQKEVFNAVVSILASKHTQPQLVALVGVSGVGKTTVLQNGVLEMIVGRHKYKHVDSAKVSRSEEGDMVTSILPKELEEFSKKAATYFPNHQVHTIPLAGMNRSETEAYLGTLGTSHSTLSKEQIVTYSGGIPFLIRQLALPGITEETAQVLVLRYLALSLVDNQRFKLASRLQDAYRKDWSKYLVTFPQIGSEMLPVSVLDMLAEDNIYGNLPRLLAKQEELRKQGIAEESSLFVAPESEGIYNAVLTSEKPRNSVTIFVPELTQADVARVQQAFGYYNGGEFDAQVGTRTNMFNIVGYGKVSIYLKDPNGNVQKMVNEYMGTGLDSERGGHLLAVEALVYETAFKEGKFPIAPSSQNQGSLLVHVHNHPGSAQPALIGWMVESLFQARGKGYVVKNDEDSYVYNPSTRHIEFITSAGPKDVLSVESLPDKARKTEPYERLKRKFGNQQLSEGLGKDALTLGDLWDIALLYTFLAYNGVEKPTDDMLQNLAWAADTTQGASRYRYSRNRKELADLDRNNSLFLRPADLNRLMKNHFSPSESKFEISHYPNGIRIIPRFDNRNKYVVLLTNLGDSPRSQEPYLTIFQETGLPMK